MGYESSREMHLNEWVDRLPESHLARREYNELRTALEQAERQRDEARGLLREIREHPNDPGRKLKIDDHLRGEGD